MRLLSSPTSPYARKVRMTLIEKGLADQVTVDAAVPLGTAEEAAAVRRVNPLAKIPALVLDTGEALYDSPVICEYLDSLGTEWLDRWARAVHGAADALEQELAHGALGFDLGAIALSAAFGYLDFRLPQIDWRAGRPRLTEAFAELAARPSFVATAPPKG